MRKAIGKWVAKQTASLLKNRSASSPLLAKVMSPTGQKWAAGASIPLAIGAEALFGGDDKNQDALLEKLKAEGVVGNGPNQVSEEEYRQHMERGTNMPFSPLEAGLEMGGIGGLLGGLITPFVGGDKKSGISNNTAEIIRQYQQGKVNRSRIKEDTGFEMDAPTLDELYGKENSTGQAESVDFTNDPWGYITGGRKKDYAIGGDFVTTQEGGKNPIRFRSEKDKNEFNTWRNDVYGKATTPEERLAALKSAPAGYRKNTRYFDQIHSLYRDTYKGRDFTSDAGKKQFKEFVTGILNNEPARVRNPATGVTSVNPNVPKNTPEDLINNYISPDGRRWTSEDEYRQVELGDINLDSGASTADLVRQGGATPAATPAPAQPVSPSVPAAVVAAAKGPKTIAEQQADDIRARGGMTAKEQDSMLAAAIKDPNSAFNAAFARGGHARAMALNRGDGYEAARKKAYEKAWGAGGEWDTGERGGENPLTGQFRDLKGYDWDSYDAFKQSGALEGINNYPEPVTPTPEPTFSWEKPDYSATADRLRLSGIKPTGDAPVPFGPTNGPENIDFAPLRRARATFYTNQRITDAAMAPTKTFDPLTAVRNMGRLSVPMELSRSARPAVVIDPTQTGPMMTKGGGLPLAQPMKRSKQRIQGQGYQYPNIPFGNQP